MSIPQSGEFVNGNEMGTNTLLVDYVYGPTIPISQFETPQDSGWIKVMVYTVLCYQNVFK